MSLDFDPDVVLARISEAQWGVAGNSLVGRALHEAFEVVAELHAAVKRVRDLCDRAENGTAEIEDPAPAPAWTTAVRRALDDENDQEPCGICSGYGCSDCREPA